MPTHTIRLHRIFRCSPEKIYRAFIDGPALCKWIPPHGFTASLQHIDAKVGGSFKMSFTNFTTGSCNSFGGTFLELAPAERIRYTDKFDDPNLPGEIVVTVILKEVLLGADATIIQEGVPEVIPESACYLGWQESLDQLAALVEPEIPN